MGYDLHLEPAKGETALRLLQHASVDVVVQPGAKFRSHRLHGLEQRGPGRRGHVATRTDHADRPDQHIVLAENRRGQHVHAVDQFAIGVFVQALANRGEPRKNLRGLDDRPVRESRQLAP
jgi:hypothetical protein